MKKLLTYGDGLYIENVMSKLTSFITSRIVPFFGFTLITILIARLNYPELGRFSYLTAMFSLPVVLMSMPLAMIGNFSVESRKTGMSEHCVFFSGLPLSLILALSGGLVGLLMCVLMNVSTEKNTLIACSIYITCIPLLIINTYLFYYIESSVSNKAMAGAKVISTFVSAISILILSLMVKKILTWHVFSIFLLVEVILLLIYVWVIFRSLKNTIRCSSNFRIKATTIKLLSIGLPVAFGLAGQKAVYFLITQRFINVSVSMISDLSILMNIIGILSLPFAAFAQIHSLFVSENPTSTHYKTFKDGATFSAVAISVILVLGGMSYPFLLELYSANPALMNINYYLSISGLFSSSSLMLLCMSHLRALHDTLFPQSLAVSVLLLGFIPAFWLQNPGSEKLYNILYLQTLFTFTIVVILVLRIKYFVKGQTEQRSLLHEKD